MWWSYNSKQIEHSCVEHAKSANLGVEVILAFYPNGLCIIDGHGVCQEIMTIDLTKLSHHLFWDTDVANVNLDEHWRFIVVRVMERGTLKDVKLV